MLLVFGAVFLNLTRFSLFEKPIKTQVLHEKVQMLRGFIYSSDKNLMAMSFKSLSLYANPQQFNKDYMASYRELFKLLNLTVQQQKQIIEAPKNFIWMKRFLSKETEEQIEDLGLLKIPGIYAVKEYRRYYPHKEVASQTMGFVGYDGQGLAGVEYSMDSWLKASNELVPLWEKENILGNDVVLTLRMDLQQQVHEEIKAVQQETQAKNITALVMEAETGDLLAIENYPSFNPNFFTSYKDNEVFRNSALSYIDEPGSTFKPLVMAFLMQWGKIKEKDSFKCHGLENFGGFTIRDEGVHGEVNPRSIITRSCNIGMVHAGQTLLKKELYEILTLYGFGKPTGISLPGEEKGIIRLPEKMTARSKLSIPIGQEIGLTSLQLVTAYTAIANQGKIMHPRIVKHIEYNGKVVETLPIKEGEHLISPKTAQLILSYMEDVVLKGTGRVAQIPGVFLAGKTGTAQIFDFSQKKYAKLNTSFIGILKHPTTQKKYIIYVVIRNPQVKEASGGRLAAPVVKKIAQHILDLF